jgi:hypothetical protein
MDEPWLKQHVRPLLTLIIISTLSACVLMDREVPDWYLKWGIIVVSTHYGIRQIEKFFKK